MIQESTSGPSGEKPTPVFPLRIGCIDSGSNAIRLVAAEFRSRSSYRVLRSERAPVRLGHGVFLNGRLTPAAMDAAVDAVGSFRKILDDLAVDHFRAVATSAVREATNGAPFVARVARETGVELEPITGAEEARLAYTAVARRIPLGSTPWVTADLGGGSVEVSLIDDTGILWSESHTMGSVRLLEELAGAEDDPGRFRRVLSEYVATLRIPFPPENVAGFVATGGNIETLARLTGIPADRDGVVRIETGDLRSVIDTLARLSYRRRVEELGLREDRADVILPAAMVYERLAVLSGAGFIHVPKVGVKEGVLLDQVDALTRRESREEALDEAVRKAALNLGRRYFFDEPHARRVATLAASLFDQLRELHGLASGDRRLLVAASLLHDIGSYISRKKHHHHSYYLIRNSDLTGLASGEIQLVAA